MAFGSVTRGGGTRPAACSLPVGHATVCWLRPSLGDASCWSTRDCRQRTARPDKLYRKHKRNPGLAPLKHQADGSDCDSCTCKPTPATPGRRPPPHSTRPVPAAVTPLGRASERMGFGCVCGTTTLLGNLADVPWGVWSNPRRRNSPPEWLTWKVWLLRQCRVPSRAPRGRSLWRCDLCCFHAPGVLAGVIWPALRTGPDDHSPRARSQPWVQAQEPPDRHDMRGTKSRSPSNTLQRQVAPLGFGQVGPETILA